MLWLFRLPTKGIYIEVLSFVELEIFVVLGKEVLLADEETVMLKTKGVIICSLAWALGADGTPLVPPTTSQSTAKRLHATTIAQELELLPVGFPMLYNIVWVSLFC